MLEIQSINHGVFTNKKKIIIITIKYKKATTSKAKFWPITHYIKGNEFGELNYFMSIHIRLNRLRELVNKQKKVAKGPVRSSSQAITYSISLKVKDVRFNSVKAKFYREKKKKKK